MNHLSAIKAKSKRFSELCSRHKVKKLYVFGSSITKDFQDAFSDINLLVEINEPDPGERGDLLLDLWDELEIFFQRKVDLLTNSAIKNPVLKANIDN